ncbi:MAG: hypothetical protein RL026_2173 [Pseudomonadota bacterium]|jgi:flagellar protein FliS
MTTYASHTRLNAYRAVAAHGGVAAADPHRLVLMLLDGALERVAAAKGALQNGAQVQKSALVHRVVEILDELRGSLDMKAGGDIARNLADLYDYCSRQLFKASLEGRADLLDEVAGLLREIRSAWVAIPGQSASRHAGA